MKPSKTCADFYGKGYRGQGNNPAVIFSLGFCFDWKIGNGDFYDYLLRPEAFNKNIHQMDNEYNCTSDFMDYMRNSEKSDGAFDATHDLLNKEQINRYRKLERSTRDDGGVKYFGVVSFNNDFLREHGLMSGNKLDIKRLKELARTGMAEMIHTSHKLEDDNTFWAGAIHTNTDNVHIHFSICEKKCRHRKRDMLELDAFDKLKSSIVNGIVGNERTVELTSMQRQLLLPLFKRSSSSSMEQAAHLIRILPKNKNLWQYNRQEIKPYRDMIDSCVKNIIDSDEALSEAVTQYIDKLDEQTAKLKEAYGDGNRHLYLRYKKNRLQDLQARMGNSLLAQLKEVDLSEIDTLKEHSKEVKTGTHPPDLQEQINYIDDVIRRFFEEQEKDEGASERLGERTVFQLQSGNRLDSTSDIVQYRLGMFYLKRGRTEEAIEQLVKASTDTGNGHNNQHAQYQLGKLFLSEEHFDALKGEHYLKLSAQQGNEFAKARLDYLARRRQNIQSSATYSSSYSPNYSASTELQRTVRQAVYTINSTSISLQIAIQRTARESEIHAKQLLAEFEYDQQMQQLQHSGRAK